ncbi:hypothetical protein BU23DRAFT_573348 [Bimuria novae-zelandiae CBS 107.79]|uniref:Uncharacterized protein n=1 Tax=Bimuria novae-zelandiae CBS 107.79 TaxID=1447943 RepID=A0A6A5V1Z3_9PLEO|nr:hypothetical protein BU23DRAFT_573348 [Bimuria novae-zelandiae CBS 107.79]
MRYSLAALMGLMALGIVQGRIVTGADNTLDKRAPELDLNHITDIPANDPSNYGLTKRVAAGGSPRPGRFNRRPSGGDPQERYNPKLFEVNDLADISDLEDAEPCTGSAKRDLKELQFDAVLDKRMSPVGKAVTWKEWETILAEIDVEFSKELESLSPEDKATKLRIIWVGGITSVKKGYRGANGKTGDIDFQWGEGTTAATKAAFKRAIERVLPNHPTLSQDRPAISASMDRKNAPNWAAAWVNSPGEPYALKSFEAVDGHLDMQIYGKMTRLYEFARDQKKQKKRDKVDVKKFMAEWFDANRGVTIELGEFIKLGDLYGHSEVEVKRIVAHTIKIVTGRPMLGMSQDIKDLVKSYGC